MEESSERQRLSEFGKLLSDYIDQLEQVPSSDLDEIDDLKMLERELATRAGPHAVREAPVLDDLWQLGVRVTKLEALSDVELDDFRAAEPILLDWLQNTTDDHLRISIASVLAGRRTGPEAMPRLIDAFRQASPDHVELRTTLARAIEKGEIRPYFDELIALVYEESHSPARSRLLEALARIDDPRVVPALVGILSDISEDVLVRYAALGGLRRVAPSLAARARASIEPYLCHSSLRWRIAARSALNRIDRTLGIVPIVAEPTPRGMDAVSSSIRLIRSWTDQVRSREISFQGERPERLVRLIEKKLGVQFPPTYRHFLRQLGGGSIGDSDFYGLPYEHDVLDALLPDVVKMTGILRRREALPLSLIPVFIDEEVLEGYYVLDTSQRDPAGECPVLLWPFTLPAYNVPLDEVAPDFGSVLVLLAQRLLAWNGAYCIHLLAPSDVDLEDVASCCSQLGKVSAHIDGSDSSVRLILNDLGSGRAVDDAELSIYLERADLRNFISPVALELAERRFGFNGYVCYSFSHRDEALVTRVLTAMLECIPAILDNEEGIILPHHQFLARVRERPLRYWWSSLDQELRNALEL